MNLSNVRVAFRWALDCALNTPNAQTNGKAIAEKLKEMGASPDEIAAMAISMIATAALMKLEQEAAAGRAASA